jgi:hypothetical protein
LPVPWKLLSMLLLLLQLQSLLLLRLQAVDFVLSVYISM